MYCNSCGQKLAEDALFCTLCGARVQPVELQGINPEQTEHHPSGQILLEYDLLWELYNYAKGRLHGVSMADGKKITICDDKIILHASNRGSTFMNTFFWGLFSLYIRKRNAKKDPYIIYPFEQIKNIYAKEQKALFNNKIMTWLVIEFQSGDEFVVIPRKPEDVLIRGNVATEVHSIVNAIKPYMNL